MLSRHLLFLLAILSFSCQQHHTPLEWEAAFTDKDLNGTFVLYDVNEDLMMVYNEERSNSIFSPASTFKICNSLIGLQTGTMLSIDDTIRWNGHEYPWDGWNKDHCLRTAMPVSCVWFYQEMARRIGEEQMQYWLDSVEYGNTSIGERVDLFWLNGSILISAQEQIAFLQRLIDNDLPFDDAVQEAVKEIIITDKTDDYVIHAKTGWAMRVKKSVGWYVGYVEKADNTYIFALNYDMTDAKTQTKYRKELTYELLKLAGVIDPE